MSQYEEKIKAEKKATKNILNAFEQLGFRFGNDGKIIYRQFRDYDLNNAVIEIRNYTLYSKDATCPVYDAQRIASILKNVQRQHIREFNNNVYDSLKHNPAVNIDEIELKDYLSLYFYWENEIDYQYYRDCFLHWLLTVRRRFFNKPVNNPISIVFNGMPNDGKSRLLNDISSLIGHGSIDIQHFEELFGDNRAFKTWREQFIIAIHELGMLSPKYAEIFKDTIDGLRNAGRTFHHNSYSSGDIVASMICATNREPKEVLSYDPDNRKVVFIPFIRLNPLNRANVYKRRDDFRKVGFLNKLFLSLDENGKDSFDDTDYHQQFTMWLKPRNADHTLTEKYIDCLIRLYGGSKITPSSIYDAYRVFHGRLARENDDGKKLSPMGVKNFNSTFKHVFEVGRDMNNRWKVVPTPKQAYEKGWCYINPDEDGLLNESTIELLKDNLDIIDIQILQDAVLNDNGGKI